MYLDELTPLYLSVGYGALGLHGELGYEGQQAVVHGQFYKHALSAHAPSTIIFRLDGRFAEFRCKVAINDDVATRGTQANFLVFADDKVIAVTPCAYAGEAPRELFADVRGAQVLTLMTTTRHWEACHSVWLDPQVSEHTPAPTTMIWRDALARVEATLPLVRLQADRCIATVVSPGYARLLDDLLGSLRANGGCEAALVVVLAIDGDDECFRVIQKHHATAIAFRAVAPRGPALKSVLYSIGSLVEAREYLCLDADTLVLGDLRPVFDALPAYSPDSILICRDAFLGYGNLQRQLSQHYRGAPQDFRLLLGNPNGESNYPLAVNDGVFAGSRVALLEVESLIRHMPNAIAWTDQHSDHGWRNQFIFNLALARLDCGVELDPTYNLQVHVHDVQLNRHDGRVQALWRGQAVRVLHFCGWGRNKYPEWRGLFGGGEVS